MCKKREKIFLIRLISRYLEKLITNPKKAIEMGIICLITNCFLCELKHTLYFQKKSLITLHSPAFYP